MEKVDISPATAEILQKSQDVIITRLKAMPADSEIVKANQHILTPTENVAVSSGGWAGGGLLSTAGFYWYTMSCELIGAGTSFAILFEASGTSWGAWATMECEIVGYFVVDPKSVAGSVNFVLAAGTVGEGAVTLTLTGTDGKYYGTFAGNADGLGIDTISGIGTLKAV